MISHVLFALALASGAMSQSTTTATILIPDWCVTQSQPTVTVLGQDALTTYSYSCTIDSSKVSSASAHASELAASAQSKASALQASLGNPKQTDKPNRRRETLGYMKRDYDCYGWDAFEACIPWEVTQGPSTWAAHYTVTGDVTVNEECTFGDGGVASGNAYCTGDGRVDPEIWGNTGADGRHTETFAKTDVDMFFIRNTVSVTLGGEGVATGGGPASTAATGSAVVAGASGTSSLASFSSPFISTATYKSTPISSSNVTIQSSSHSVVFSAPASVATTNTAGGVVNAQSTGLAAPIAIPTGAVAWMGTAGGILAVAVML